MAVPQDALASLRPDIGEVFMEWDLERQMSGYIAREALPVKEVLNKVGSFSTVRKDQLLKVANTLRAPGGPYSRADTAFTKTPWQTQDRGHEEPIDDNDRAAFQQFIDAELVAALRARDVVLRDAEQRTAALLENTTTFTNAAAGVTWDTPATADPVKDVVDAKKAIRARTGQIANFVIVPWPTLQDLVQVSNVKTNSNHVLDMRLGVAAQASFVSVLFGVPTVLIPGVSKLTSAEGAATTVVADIWDPANVFVGVRNETDDLRSIAVGRTFHWSGDGSSATGIAEQYRDEAIRSLIMRIRHEVQEQVIYSDAGQIITGVV